MHARPKTRKSLIPHDRGSEKPRMLRGFGSATAIESRICSSRQKK